MNQNNPGGASKPRRSFYENPGRGVRRYLWAADLARGKDVIEIGCGYGQGSAFIAEHGANSVTGTDVDELALNFASAHYHRPNLHFINPAQGWSNSFTNQFDLAILFEVFEHVEDPAALLQEVSRVLREGGSVILSTPNRTHTELMYVHGRSPNPYHVREYYPDELISIVNQTFEVEGLFAEYSEADLGRTTGTLAEMRRLSAYNLSCRVPSFVKRFVPSRIKNGWLRLRGYSTAMAEEGRWREFRIEPVNKPADLDIRFETQLITGRVRPRQQSPSREISKTHAAELTYLRNAAPGASTPRSNLTCEFAFYVHHGQS